MSKTVGNQVPVVPLVRGLPFTSPWLLAPMEGVTDARYRDVMLSRNDPADLGGAFTEFLRVSDHPLPREVIRRHLGTRRFLTPVGVQIMGSDVAAVAESARRAAELGAPLIDLNFGCPAKGALRSCAGSAMLDDPSSLERLVRACVLAQSRVPVTGKIRAGVADASRVEELARAVEQGGASLLTIHCRTRIEHYCEAVDWTRIARAVNAVSIPVCGNGGILVHADLERMRRETGCQFGMVGRAALGDPWIFSGRTVDRSTAAAFLVDYNESMLRDGHRSQACFGRIKQLVKHWTAGGLFPPEERRRWLLASDAEASMNELAAISRRE